MSLVLWCICIHGTHIVFVCFACAYMMLLIVSSPLSLTHECSTCLQRVPFSKRPRRVQTRVRRSLRYSHNKEEAHGYNVPTPRYSPSVSVQKENTTSRGCGCGNRHAYWAAWPICRLSYSWRAPSRVIHSFGHVFCKSKSSSLGKWERTCAVQRNFPMAIGCRQFKLTLVE